MSEPEQDLPVPDRRQTDDVRLALAMIMQGQTDLKEQIKDVKSDVKDLRHVVDNVPDLIDDKLQKFVTNDRFEPIQKLVFGLVGMVLLTIGGAILATVLKSHGVAP